MNNRTIQRSLGLLAITLLIGTAPAIVRGDNAPDRCRDCHSSAQKMREFGFSRFTVTEQEVELQNRVSATCPGCHVGYPACGKKGEAREVTGSSPLAVKKYQKAERR